MCFAPVGMKWKERWSKLGTYDRRWFKLRWPYFPEDFDWSFFQIAPAAQQLPFLVGNERFSFVGVRPDLPKLEGRLPGLRVRCFLQLTAAAGSGFREVPLALDTVTFVTDELKVALVWRGTTDVSDEEAPEVDAIFLLKEELSAPPLSLEQARAHYLEAATPKPPEETSPEDEAPVAEEPQVAAEAPVEEDAHAVVRRELIAAGVPESALADVTREPPPPPKPDDLARQMRAAGATEEQIAALMAAITPDPEDAPPAPPMPLRERVIARLKSGEPFDDLDLAGADLSDLDFSGRSLERTLLKGANLTRAVLTEAKLAGAVLAAANLTDARLCAADLTGADLTGIRAPRADFTGATLEATELNGAKLQAAIFDQAKGSVTVPAGVTRTAE